MTAAADSSGGTHLAIDLLIPAARDLVRELPADLDQATTAQLEAAAATAQRAWSIQRKSLGQRDGRDPAADDLGGAGLKRVRAALRDAITARIAVRGPTRWQRRRCAASSTPAARSAATPPGC